MKLLLWTVLWYGRCVLVPPAWMDISVSAGFEYDACFRYDYKVVVDEKKRKKCSNQSYIFIILYDSDVFVTIFN